MCGVVCCDNENSPNEHDRADVKAVSKINMIQTYYFFGKTGFFFCIHGSVHRESNLITVQQDATYSVNYVSVGSLHVSGVDTHHQELV